MEKFDIYEEIASRTNGDIYLGVVGPVRTGKSTFVSKFLNDFIIPNINNKLQKQIAVDEMPQSAAGKTVMTTEPKFSPANAVKITLKNKSTANIRLIDCVGYFVEGANGSMDGDKERMVKTPWSEKEIPFIKAAEIGTKKVIEEYSTIGILITTDGSFTEIDRSAYISAEERTVKELKAHKKPFVILLNVKNPESESSVRLSESLEQKYNVPVIAVNVTELNKDSISEITERILMEFPMQSFNVNIPEWMQALPEDNKLINSLICSLKESSKSVVKMRDYANLVSSLTENENFENLELKELNLGRGIAEYGVNVKEGVFYKAISDECGEDLTSDYKLMSYIKSFSSSKKKFDKIKDALTEAEETGYGVVIPKLEDMNLEEPKTVKQGGKYGVKIRAVAPSLHIIKVDVATEVSPIVGSEKQSEDFVNYLNEQISETPDALRKTNVFGKSLEDLVSEGLSEKVVAMPKDTQVKMRKTLTKMVNENKGGILCILL